MRLTDHDLRQIDAQYLARLSPAQLLPVSGPLWADLKVARERANQTPPNSSRPPGSLAPGEGPAPDTREQEPPPPERRRKRTAPPADAEPPAQPACGAPRKPRGKQPGSAGPGRLVTLPLTGEEIHRAAHCEACGADLAAAAPFVAGTGLYVLEVVMAAPGLRVTHVKHVYGATACPCGHLPRPAPGRCPAEDDWTVELTEGHLIGPPRGALIVCLALRMRLSRARMRELRHAWLGLQLSGGVLNTAITAGGRAVAPLGEQLLAAVHQATVLHVDETGWKENGRTCWLWVLTTVNTTLFVIGNRSWAVMADLLEAYAGWLMTDGYVAYRKFARRLRGLAHLLRKARGLAESVTPATPACGTQVLTCLTTVVEAVYRARAGPANDWRVELAEDLAALRVACGQQRDSDHDKTRQLARELLNDWETIWTVVDHPELPLTNNRAERALRHWVIARKLSYGTRTPPGRRALALLASVIETCRQRPVSPWTYLAAVITERRQGQTAPPLPTAA